MRYEVADIFYSIKGEGVWTGTAMSFIRLARCNLYCKFCDTDFSKKFTLDEYQLANAVKKFPSKRVVITGGEPLVHDLKPLVKELHRHGFQVHLETNGSLPIPPNTFDWVAMCPKSDKLLIRNNLAIANEIKILAGRPKWREFALGIKEAVHLQGLTAHLWIMPLTSSFDRDNKRIKKNDREAYNFCKQNLSFALCAQVHKLYGFK